MSSANWNLHVLHGSVKGADNGVNQLSLTATESLYREWAQKNKPATFIHKLTSGKEVTVVVHPDSKGSTLPKKD